MSIKYATELTRSEQRLLERLEKLEKYRFFNYLISISGIALSLVLIALGHLFRIELTFFSGLYILFAGVFMLVTVITHLKYYKLIKKLIGKPEEQ